MKNILDEFIETSNDIMVLRLFAKEHYRTGKIDRAMYKRLNMIADKHKELFEELAAIAEESIEREKTLALLEAEVAVWAKAEQEGKLFIQHGEEVKK